MELSPHVKNISVDLFDDFARTLNRFENCLTEFSFADKGCSAFNRAIYMDKVQPAFLQELSLRENNVAFLTDCSRDKIDAPINKTIFRQAKNESISAKSIISFDIDFKMIEPNFLSMSLNGKQNFSISIAGQLVDKIQQNNLPVWIVNYSGNGLHIHFKLKPLSIINPNTYKLNYQHWCDVLSLALGEKLIFDTSCSNVARLMRLPLSTNWKDQNCPIKNVIFYHSPSADASTFFCDRSEPLAQTRRSHPSFVKILEHFKYGKMNTITNKGGQIICSSPFTNDSSPSFYFHPEKQVFYDFSRGKGGGLYTLIADLAGLNHGYMPTEVEHILNDIEGTQNKGFKQDRFILRSDGVWFNKEVDGDSEGLWICSPLTVEAMTRSKSGDAWGRVLSLYDQDGCRKSFAMPMELLAGDGLELRKELLRRGLHISQNRKARFHLMEYIQNCETTNRMRCVNRIGWHNDAYVLPQKTFHKDDIAESLILQKEGDFAPFQTSGTLNDWQHQVASLCFGNERLIFALSVAFAPPLLYLLGEESGGIHFFGPSSIGKTLALRVAGSVWGGGGLNGFLKKWRATVNGLEALAESRCDSLLILDEIAEISPRDAAISTYMLANGSGKKRMTKDQNLNPSAEWRIIFLSSGEIGLANHLATVGEEHRGGQFVRLVEIEADAGYGFGIFNHFGNYKNPSLLADTIRTNCARYYGTPINAYLTELVKMKNPEEQLHSYIASFLSEVDPLLSSGQLMRVAKRFGLIAAGGIIAVKMKILPFDERDIFDAVKSCFTSWAKNYQNHADFETQKILSQIRQYLQFSGCAYFPEWDGKSSVNFSGKCSGYRLITADGSIEWLILNEVFKNDICKGLDFRKTIRELKNLQLLKRDRSGKNSIPMRLPNFGLVRVYHLSSEIFAEKSGNKSSPEHMEK